VKLISPLSIIPLLGEPVLSGVEGGRGGFHLIMSNCFLREFEKKE